MKSAESWVSHLNFSFYRIESQCNLLARCVSLRIVASIGSMVSNAHDNIRSTSSVYLYTQAENPKMFNRQTSKHYRLWRISNFQQRLKRSFNQSLFSAEAQTKSIHASAHSLGKHTHYPLSLMLMHRRFHVPCNLFIYKKLGKSISAAWKKYLPEKREKKASEEHRN